MTQIIRAAALGILILTAGPQAEAKTRGAAATVSSAKCSVPDGWTAVAQRRPDYILFGELHGTRQSPEFVGNLACALAMGGQSVLVGVELSALDNDAIQAAWVLSEQQFPTALHKIGWAGQLDGIYSQAMFDLLVGLHALARNGHPVAVVAFNPGDAQEAKFSSMAGQDPHEAAQAENIRNVATITHADWVLVLVGNVHARKKSFPEAGVFHPMAMQLASATRVVSLNLAIAGGTMWNCLLRPGFSLASGKPVTTSAVDCGDHPAKSDATFDRLPFIALDSLPGHPSDAAYDGYFWVGPIKGSPPKVPKPRNTGHLHR